MIKNGLYILLLFVAPITAQDKASYVQLFEDSWVAADSTLAYGHANEQISGGSFDQSLYYWGWPMKGLLWQWQGTGDLRWLNHMIEMTDMMTDKAVLVDATHYGWPNSADSRGIPLWFSYSWRTVTDMLRVMKDSPTLLATSHGQSGWAGTTYQDEYDFILQWTEDNIWDMWITESYGGAVGGALYRSLTHMASHWWMIAMDLHYCTGTQEYLDVYNNMYSDGFPATTSFPGANFDDQMFYHATQTDAQVWYVNWGGSTMQDTDHSSDVVEAFVHSYLNGYGNYTEADMISFANTYDHLMWVNNNIDVETTSYINGTGSVGSVYGNKSYGWYLTSAWDNDLITRLETYVDGYTDWTSISTAHVGALVFAESIRGNSLFYPETTGGAADTTTPTVANLVVTDDSNTCFKASFNPYDSVKLTNEPAKAQGRIGTTSGVYTDTGIISGFYSSHGYRFGCGLNGIDPLVAGTTYYYQIYLEDEAGNGAWSSEYTHTTSNDASVPVTNITWTTDAQTIYPLESVNLAITWTPTNATNKGYTLSSSNTSVLSNAGLWVSEGSANLTVTADDTTNGTLTDVMSVTVSAAPISTKAALNAGKIKGGTIYIRQ